jgi:DNA repair exonuclease SbcCD ATPase subunit
MSNLSEEMSNLSDNVSNKIDWLADQMVKRGSAASYELKITEQQKQFLENIQKLLMQAIQNPSHAIEEANKALREGNKRYEEKIAKLNTDINGLRALNDEIKQTPQAQEIMRTLAENRKLKDEIRGITHTLRCYEIRLGINGATMNGEELYRAFMTVCPDAYDWEGLNKESQMAWGRFAQKSFPVCTK